MTDTKLSFAKNQRRLLLTVSVGLLLILFSALSYFSTSPGLVIHTGTPGGSSSSAAARDSGMPATAGSMNGMDSAAQEGIMKLMQRLQQNPSDMEALSGLTEHFMHTQDWQRAETFAMRAVLAAPNETKPLYMLGVIQHNQKRHAEAAANLEKVAATDNDPSVRYSLGILYAYYLNDPDKGIGQFEKALKTPGITPELKTSVLEEIEKAKAHKTHTPQK